jgi:hypothetical protein
MKSTQLIFFNSLLIQCIIIGLILIPNLTFANTITGLTAFYRDGQVFLTWTNVAGPENFYKVYRSLSPVAYGWQLSGCEYLGKTHQLSARDINLTTHYNQDYYLRIDSAGTPLPVSSGLFVATTLEEGNYYYTVTVQTSNNEDTTIISGSNTTIQPITEWVSKPRPVFQQTVTISGRPIEIYTNFFSFKVDSNQPPINEAGWLASDFLINRNMNTGNQPLLVRWHGGGTDFFAQIATTVSNAINLNLETILPSGISGEYWGSNSGFNLFYKNEAIPTSGVNHNYFQQVYKHTIDWAIEYLAIDSNRIYFDGSSSGACGAFAYIQMYPEKIAAVKLLVPCFNVGFENDADSMCSLNTGGKNRNSIDQLLGKVSTNLPNSLGYPTYSMLNGAWMAHHFANRNYPFVYAINGKADFVVGWTEKTIYYDSINANATGGYYFWDSRSHGGNSRFWTDANFDLLRFKRNVSYPAFSNCSLNEDYGDGSKNSGATYGTVNGALDWSDEIDDTETTWSAHCFIRNLKALYNQEVIYPDSATVDISPKRLQHFNPPAVSIIRWNVIYRQDTIQSGSQVYTGGVITIRNIKVFKDTITLALSYLPADTFYTDGDFDGYGNPAATIIAASIPPGYAEDNSDCDDTNPLIHPGSLETCNHSDDDCDGETDEGVQTVFYADADQDGFGTSNHFALSCYAPDGFVGDTTDCNDNDMNIHPFLAEVCNYVDDNCDGRIDEALQSIFYADSDSDGYGNLNTSISACIETSGFVSDTTDCNDSNPNIHPSQSEACNGIDDNCDSQVDEGAVAIFYFDADADGFGNADSTVMSCPAPEGFVFNAADCNDSDATISPLNNETCNGTDDNCDGAVDEGVQFVFFADADGDGFGDVNSAISSCSMQTGYVSDTTDCDDKELTISPSGTETCNGTDDNCNAEVDEGVQFVFFADADGDGFGDINAAISSCIMQTGYVTDNTDCDDNEITISPSGIESCNGADDNCNGQVDEGVQSVFYADDDGDGFGDVSSTTLSCFAANGYLSDTTDCDDADIHIHPFSTEVCNNTDDNCDSQVDEGVQSIFYADADGDGFGDVSSTTLSCFAANGYLSDTTDCNDADIHIHPFSPEVCNNTDDNCDNQVDEGVQSIFYADADGDGFGDINSFVSSCIVPNGYVTDPSDCNDVDFTISPSGIEACNGFDDNCNGQVDENTVSAQIVPAGTFTICKGSALLLQANTGTGLTYQWQINGINIIGATASTFDVLDAADYTVSVTAGSCSVVSSATTVIVNALPAATVTPSDKIKICAGLPVTFQANTGASLTPQWLHNGQEIPGATNSVYTTTTPGNYTVFIKKSNGCEKLSEATKLSNYSTPSTKITFVGQLNICTTGFVLFNAKVLNNCSYQWYKDNLAIADATGYSYTATSAGSYHYAATTQEGCSAISGSKTVKACKSAHSIVNTKPLVTVFPNPASEFFTINIEMEEHFTGTALLSLSNLSGKVVYREAIMIDQGKLQKTLDINSGMAAGIYMLKIITAENVINMPVSIIR